MQTTNIVEMLNEHYSKLTKSEKRIANYLYNNLSEVQYMSITSLAEACKVAEVTVFRFCKSLKYEGYNEFKFSIAKSFAQSYTEPDTESSQLPLYGQVDCNDSFEDMCKKLYSTEVSAIVQTLERLKENDVMRAVDILHASRRVYCLGQGGSLILSMAAWSRFASISPNFFCVEDSHLQAVTTSLLSKGDTLLIFSYSGATKDMLDILPMARENGVKIILVTHYANSPAAGYADVVLLCGSNEGPLQVGSVAAKVAQLFIIDVLFNEFWRRDSAQAAQNNEVTSSVTSRKLL